MRATRLFAHCLQDTIAVHTAGTLYCFEILKKGIRLGLDMMRQSVCRYNNSHQGIKGFSVLIEHLDQLTEQFWYLHDARTWTACMSSCTTPAEKRTTRSPNEVDSSVSILGFKSLSKLGAVLFWLELTNQQFIDAWFFRIYCRKVHIPLF